MGSTIGIHSPIPYLLTNREVILTSAYLHVLKIRGSAVGRARKEA